MTPFASREGLWTVFSGLSAAHSLDVVTESAPRTFGNNEAENITSPTSWGALPDEIRLSVLNVKEDGNYALDLHDLAKFSLTSKLSQSDAVSSGLTPERRGFAATHFSSSSRARLIRDKFRAEGINTSARTRIGTPLELSLTTLNRYFKTLRVNRLL